MATVGGLALAEEKADRPWSALTSLGDRSGVVLLLLGCEGVRLASAARLAAESPAYLLLGIIELCTGTESLLVPANLLPGADREHPVLLKSARSSSSAKVEY